jgi:hypothetical protein
MFATGRSGRAAIAMTDRAPHGHGRNMASRGWKAALAVALGAGLICGEGCGDAATVAPRPGVAAPDASAEAGAAQEVNTLLVAISGGGCLPQALVTNSGGYVGCVILEALPTPGDESVCNGITGRSVPDPHTLTNLRAIAGLNPRMPICAITQLAASSLMGASCATSAEAGWCYQKGEGEGMCAQSIVFSPSGTPEMGARVWLDCQNQNQE